MRLTLKILIPITLILALIQTIALVDMHEVYSSSNVYCTLSTRDGSVWYGTQNGLYASEKQQRPIGRPLPSLARHPHPSVYALAYDSVRSRLWIGGWDNLYCYDLLGKNYLNTTNIHVDMTVALTMQADGTIVAYTHRGQFVASLADSINGGASKQINNTFYPKRIDDAESLPQVDRYDKTPFVLILSTTVAWWILCLILIYLFLKTPKQHNNTDKDQQTKPEDELADISTNRSYLQPKEEERQDEPNQDEATDNQHEADYRFVNRLNALVDANLANPDFTIEQMASDMALSRAQLFRKLKSISNTTPLALITERRMQKAAELLLIDDADINEICEKVGVSDQSNFRRSFIKHFGISPKEYVKKKRTSEQ